MLQENLETTQHKCILLGLNCVDDRENVEGGSFQIMKCILCYNNHVNILNQNTKETKCLIPYIIKTMQ
jgi:hypothetical protein